MVMKSESVDRRLTVCYKLEDCKNKNLFVQDFSKKQLFFQLLFSTLNKSSIQVFSCIISSVSFWVLKSKHFLNKLYHVVLIFDSLGAKCFSFHNYRGKSWSFFQHECNFLFMLTKMIRIKWIKIANACKNYMLTWHWNTVKSFGQFPERFLCQLVTRCACS